MQTSVILFFSGVFVFLSIIVGIIAGWHINDVVYNLMANKNEMTHPEMYDENGIWINEELLSVKFVKEEEEEDDYY
ncbi:hypothetical protein Np050604_222 [Cyanophage S-RIM44]|uniref:Uncharacterized protein n=2 Tax=Vellamovirus TaxID=2733139 RepID=A0A127KND8_9CAUD|nr:hypothetical protein Syn1_226 [Prochlorococcus phage Syn1]YP_009783357.1 hypothetical protein HOQ83_gp046 [Cyanophage S-RIM44]ADO99322.1 hypothetical protein Syn1_226 [Prochlorococcus phage Syn1]AMO43461.1 hypothetical protein W270710_222 [Cyanophage S-RIM44]AOO11701.1 hypothetical protein ES420910_224 [Cyanophage S-RIM44]AOO11933.1 hypothetical protein Np050604_222 [Cyanophage S-RIM44]AOO12167.1 hypothetical protein Np200711_225 [Cyanophage S-RIM44]